MGDPEPKDKYKTGNHGIGHWWGLCQIGKHFFFDFIGGPNCAAHLNQEKI